MEFGTLDDVVYGAVEVVETAGPTIRRVIAENPSKFTYRGTGTYIVGRGDVAVIDPGPLLDSHRDALAAALVGERVRAICVTHCHNDHSPLAAWLAAETGAPTYTFGPHVVDPDDMDSDDPGGASGEPSEGVKVEEAIDTAFVPTVAVPDGAVAATGGDGAERWTLRAVHTPGHTSNHHCYELHELGILFPGDHVMGWSTTVVSPPDGDMRAYVDSLAKVAGRSDRRLWPTHGPAIDQPQRYVAALLDHRLQRERQVLGAVRDGLDTIPVIVAVLYADVDEGLHKPAARSVLAHLRKLVADGLVVDTGDPEHRWTAA